MKVLGGNIWDFFSAFPAVGQKGKRERKVKSCQFQDFLVNVGKNPPANVGDVSSIPDPEDPTC